MKLHIQLAGEADLKPQAQQTWAAFEKAIALPFNYDTVEFSTCDDTAVDSVAEAQFHDGVATITFARTLLDAPLVERHLTLLHESLHIASFSGRLREMYATVTRLEHTIWSDVVDRIVEMSQRGVVGPFAERYGPYNSIARLLGAHLFEVEVELALGAQYPEHVAARNQHYIKLKKQGLTRDAFTGSLAGCRPYYVLLHQLRAELGGVLSGDDNVTRELLSSAEGIPGFMEPTDENEMAALHRMLSPKSNDFADLPRWGAATYEAVVRRVTERIWSDSESSTEHY